MPIPGIGSKAPSFSLPSTTGQKISLKDYSGENAKNVVLYFYPKDDTPGCTTEACGFRDGQKKFAAKDTVILGVSCDSVASHQKFTEKYELPFPLLADEDHVVAAKYGVWVEKNMYGKKSMGIQRATFLIDKEGKIAASWPRVKVDGHVDAVADAVKALEK